MCNFINRDCAAKRWHMLYKTQTEAYRLWQTSSHHLAAIELVRVKHCTRRRGHAAIVL